MRTWTAGANFSLQAPRGNNNGNSDSSGFTGNEGLEQVVEILFFQPDVETGSAGLEQLSIKPYRTDDISSLFSTARLNINRMSCNIGDDIIGCDDEEGCLAFAASDGHARRKATGDLFCFEDDRAASSWGVQGQYGETVESYGSGLKIAAP